jgi:putative ABC transport system ATP-binding protein
LLLADEPTGNLDSKSARDVLGLFGELHAAGQTLVLVTHDPEIASIAQRTIYLRDGKVAEAHA